MAKQQQRHIFSRFVIPGVIVLIVLYLIVSAWIGLRDAYPTEVAYTDTMEDSLSANGWVVRSEQPISGGSGLVQLQRDQQEKVGKGQTIAVVYQDEQYVEHQEQLLEAKADLTALQFATYDGSPSGVVLEEQMLTAMTDLRRLASSGNYTTLSDQADTYRKLILRQEFLVSGTAAAEMNAAAAGLYDSYSTLMGYQSGATTITAPASGLFSSHLDGYETLLSPSTFTGIDPTGLAELDELAPRSEEGTLGKLVTGSDWYYAILVPGDYAAQFVAGNSASIYFDSLSTTLKMTVYSVSEVQRDQAVVVFRSARDMDKAGRAGASSSAARRGCACRSRASTSRTTGRSACTWSRATSRGSVRWRSWPRTRTPTSSRPRRPPPRTPGSCMPGTRSSSRPRRSRTARSSAEGGAGRKTTAGPRPGRDR